jgi:hypothetical protein
MFHYPIIGQGRVNKAQGAARLYKEQNIPRRHARLIRSSTGVLISLGQPTTHLNSKLQESVIYQKATHRHIVNSIKSISHLETTP